MELKELENQVEISEQELGNMFSRCEGYFNVRPNKDKCMISLTPTGKRFKEYIVKTEKKYDDTVWNQLIYKNCNNIIDGFKKSYRSGNIKFIWMGSVMIIREQFGIIIMRH